MKKFINRFSFLSRIVLAVLLGIGAIVLSHFIYNAFPIHSYFPFVGELLLVLATWIMYRTDGQNLPALGLNPTFKNVAFLLFGLAIGVTAFLAVTALRTFYTGEQWHFSSAVNAPALVKSLYYVLPTVVVQELMFRGYPFTKTVSRFGVVKANVIFAILFMLVHVVDRDVLRNPAQMVMLAVCIPIGHLWFAAALLRSKTILFPIGLHWGNNWAVTHLAGMRDSDQTFFYLTHQKVFTTWPPFIISLLIFNVFFLLVTWATWKARWPFATSSTRNR